MAENDGRDAEMNALLEIEGVDSAKIAEQINQKKGTKSESVKTDPVKTDPVKTDPVKTDPIKTEVPDTEAIRTTMLNEMFGESFKTVEDVKKADIPKSLQERDSLRQKVTELETQLSKKPKHNFASDDIAMYNEFARETGIKDASVFNKINATDVANMDSMDALVLQHIIENPSLAGQEPQVRRYFERKYDVDSSKIDPRKVESGDLTQEELEQNKLEYQTNLIGVTSDGGRAKAKLIELKGKIKMPEFAAEETPADKKWTPEVVKSQTATWTTVNEKMIAEFAKIPITIKGVKEPIVNFVLPEETSKTILKNAVDYAISNQLEVNEANVSSVARAMYSDAIFSNLDEIYHAIFERARSMTEEEYMKLYHNPSPRNSDQPPAKQDEESFESKVDKAAKAEMSR